MNQTRARPGKPARWIEMPALLLALYAALIGGYFVTRYGAQWTETDTSTLTRAIAAVHAYGTIDPPEGLIYAHGFAYPVTATTLLAATGLSVQALQAVLWPILGALGLAVSAFAFYSQVTPDRPTALLAGLFLLSQPDVLFVTLRGSHEKLSWPLMMVALLLLCRSSGRSLRATAVPVVLFYLVVFAMIATNVFFASTLMVAVTLSLALGALVMLALRGRVGVAAGHERLVYVSLSTGLLVFIFVFYIYWPALHDLQVLRIVADKLAVLLLGFEAQGQPYEYITTGWTSTGAYLGLTAFTWLLIGGSFIAWLARGRQILRRQESFNLRDNLDWLLYAGFAVQVALAIVVDLSGALAANLQLRLFPGFTVMAAVLLARAVQRIMISSRLHGKQRQLAYALLGLASAWFALASAFKATSEPLFSNKWTFYARSEDAAMSWVDPHVYANIWTGIDGRLRELFRFRYAYQFSPINWYDAYALKPWDTYILIAERERLRGMRVGVAMPHVLDWNRVYDNGDNALYHRRPLTPYQR
ncbi:MAG: hypothetical protein JXM73_11320 [Anaerolineae bacterium]|nr:hypothetical protein [Anaerolineae bacterium]